MIQSIKPDPQLSLSFFFSWILHLSPPESPRIAARAQMTKTSPTIQKMTAMLALLHSTIGLYARPETFRDRLETWGQHSGMQGHYKWREFLSGHLQRDGHGTRPSQLEEDIHSIQGDMTETNYLRTSQQFTC